MGMMAHARRAPYWSARRQPTKSPRTPLLHGFESDELHPALFGTDETSPDLQPGSGREQDGGRRSTAPVNARNPPPERGFLLLLGYLDSNQEWRDPETAVLPITPYPSDRSLAPRNEFTRSSSAAKPSDACRVRAQVGERRQAAHRLVPTENSQQRRRDATPRHGDARRTHGAASGPCRPPTAMPWIAPRDYALQRGRAGAQHRGVVAGASPTASSS